MQNTATFVLFDCLIPSTSTAVWMSERVSEGEKGEELGVVWCGAVRGSPNAVCYRP